MQKEQLEQLETIIKSQVKTSFASNSRDRLDP